MEEGLDLEKLLEGMKPSIVSPNLGNILSANSKARPKLIAHLIIRGMAAQLKDPVAKEIMHKGEIHTIRYVNVEPLCTGSWAQVSLMLLHLSFGEQSTVIEALYPENLQLTAKAFAAVFTPEPTAQAVAIRRDKDLLDGIEQANAGIAMALSLLKGVGTIPHADEIKKNRQAMAKLVEASTERDKYHKAHLSSQGAAKHRDGLAR